MSKFINPRGRRTAAIAICDRCKLKFPWDELRPDGNTPGLMVCEKDSDEYDPYRLPFAPADADISLRFVRPDTPLEPTGSNFPDTLRSERE